MPFLNYKPQKLQFRVLLAGLTVAIVTYYVMKRTTTRAPMVGQFFFCYHDSSLKWLRVVILTHQNVSAGNCFEPPEGRCLLLLAHTPSAHHARYGLTATRALGLTLTQSTTLPCARLKLKQNFPTVIKSSLINLY